MTRGDAERVFSAVMEGCRSAERELRARAARALCALTPAGSSSVAGLVDLVRNGEAEVAAAAAACLAGSSELDEASIDALTARCADPDAGLRRACARALGAGGRGAVRAIPPLLARLDDPDRQVRRAAARALGRLEQPDAKTVEALAAVLGDGDLAGVAVRALERWGKTALPAVPGLIQALQNQEVRVDAARTLGRVASESRPAREALLAALESTRDREFCRQLLAISPEIGPAAGAWITGQMASPEGWCFWGSPNHIVAAVGDSMQGAVSALLAILAKDDRFARSQAIQVLGAMGPAAREAVPRLRALSEDREVDLEVQVAARRALRRIGL
jgi:HEAT repeat protein